MTFGETSFDLDLSKAPKLSLAALVFDSIKVEVFFKH